MAVAEIQKVAKKNKKGDETSKAYGTLIRVSEEFADAMKDAAGFEKVSMADFADAHLLPIVKRRYRDQVVKTARRLEGSED